MNTVATAPAAGAPANAGAPTRTRRVVDAPMRMFHALFALSFALAYLTGDSEQWRALHVTLGYTMAGLLGFRLLYGLFGPRPVRLAALGRKLAALPAWTRATAGALRHGRPGEAPWQQGQNLAMALVVASLLALVVPLVLAGVATYEDWGAWLGGEWTEEVHEALAQVMLTLVIAHLALLVVLSVLRRRNQALPMLTGRAAGAGPDLVTNRGALAALLLVAVLAFGAWQWQQAPNGLLPAATAAGVHDRGHDDDD